VCRRALASGLVALLAGGLLAAGARADLGDPKKQRTAADMALARSILPKLSDLPAGWKAKASSSSSSSSFSCAGFRPDLSDLVETGYAETPDLSMGDQNLVSGFAAVFRSEAESSKAYARVVKPALARCLRVLFEKESTKTLKVKVLSVRRSRVPNLKARADAFRVVARFSGSGLTLPAHLDFLFLQRGRAVAGVLLLHFPQPVARGLETEIAAAIDGRLGAA
jgi:hypothetical protein